MKRTRTRTSLAVATVAALTAANAAADVAAAALDRPQTVMELRQYTLHPGKRDVLIDLFDRNFVEGQEAQGMRIIGQFRDLDNPDHFVWMRSFADMPARAAALNGFYYGPIWKSQREAANATMVDSDNVLLLKPARPETAFANSTAPLPPLDAKGAGKGLVVGNIVYLRPKTPGNFQDFFEQELKPQWEAAGAAVIAELVTDHNANNFPPLPVREGENVFIWFSTFADTAAYERQNRRLAESAEWRAAAGRLSLWTFQPLQTLRLTPTARSRLHGG
jgi:quinol monooxygenase YgiN